MGQKLLLELVKQKLKAFVNTFVEYLTPASYVNLS